MSEPIELAGDAATAHVRAAVRARGYAVVRAPDPVRALAAVDPWAFAHALFGEPPELVERQPIRAIAGGRSFASSAVFTPLHTDSQSYRGVPAHAQAVTCVRPAPSGGETLLVDTWDLLARVGERDPGLFGELLETPRRIPFYFGEVVGPTVTRRGGSFAFTHAPAARDPIARRLEPHLTAAPIVELPLAAGETLLVDNHRMLHGRRAFEDTRRELTRVLVWLARPLAQNPDPRLSHLPDLAEPAPSDEARARLAIVLAMLRGTPPGVLAARAGIAERELYAWREAALAAAARALASG